MQIHESSGLGDIGGVNWEMAGLLILAWLVCYLCVCKGVKISGKVSVVKIVRTYMLFPIFTEVVGRYYTERLVILSIRINNL